MVAGRWLQEPAAMERVAISENKEIASKDQSMGDRRKSTAIQASVACQIHSSPDNRSCSYRRVERIDLDGRPFYEAVTEALNKYTDTSTASNVPILLRV